jgi:hypothetical protein
LYWKSQTQRAQQFCTSVNKFLKGTDQNEEISDTSVFELLVQLGKLRENGVLTNDEFTEQKRSFWKSYKDNTTQK